MVDWSMYVCDVHFLLIWLLLTKNYTSNNLIKAVTSLLRFNPRNLRVIVGWPPSLKPKTDLI